MLRLMSFIGLISMMVIAWLISNNRKKMDWRVIGGGLFLQFLLALFILKTSMGMFLFEKAKTAVDALISMSDEGAKFVFGANFTEHFFAFKVLPTIIFVSSLTYMLFYWGVIQKVVNWMAWIMNKVMGISGAESLVTAANVFCGQTEAPFFIKPYLKTMTRSEIMCMMTGGMATVSGSILAAYVGFGVSAGHLLAASIMSAPAAILIAKIIYPETEVSPTMGHVDVKIEMDEVNTFEAACKGATDGLKLALNVATMLIAFIALIALANKGLNWVVGHFGYETSLESILGVLFMPFAFLMGVPWEECAKVGQLLGTKTIINEFIAYDQLGKMISSGQLSQRSITIVTYALCGFANFASIAIQIGGIGSLEPSRRKDFAKVGLKSMIGGTLAAFMTACIAGILI